MLKILLAVDGSQGALAAVRHALRLTRNGLHASFVLLNVQEPASLYEVVVAHDAQVLDEISAGAAADALAPAQALLDDAGASVEVEIAHGDPAQMIVDVCERYDCELIVVGAHGVAGPRSARHVGSVANAVLHAAGVPVTVAREAEAESEGESAGEDAVD